MSTAIVALLTDFGTRDHYVAAMKAVVLGVCPGATLVDITHEVPPQDIRAGALELAACAPYFPSGTVFLVVVDPGVGSPRRAIAVAAGGRLAVAPDNGVLTPMLRSDERADVVGLDNPQYARPIVSRTFEGRDRFAPAAGWLASGVPLAALGSPITDPVLLEDVRLAVGHDAIDAEVVRVDRFGNLITNADAATLARFASGQPLDVYCGRTVVPGLSQTYADVRSGERCALIGSSGHLEIAVAGGSAAAQLGLAVGARVVVRRAHRP